MRDDTGDLFKRGLWLAGGCGALGAVLLLRMQGGDIFFTACAWLVLSIFVGAAGFETGRDNVDLALTAVALAASILGLLMYAYAFFGGRMGADLVDLGPIFLLVGFALGVVCAAVQLKDVYADLVQLAKERREEQQAMAAAEDAASGPTKACPKCGQQVPGYAGACRYCKHIFSM